MGFLQLPINSIFPLSVVYRIIGWGLFVCINTCMYACINVFISLYMYVLCMHVSVYVFMYRTYVHDASRYAMNLILLNGLVRGPGSPRSATGQNA